MTDTPPATPPTPSPPPSPTPSPSRQARMVEVIVAVTGGEIVLCGASYFHVIDVREPTHPAAPGMAWWGSWWNAADGVWRDPAVWHITPDNCPHIPQILSAADRARLGWADL